MSEPSDRTYEPTDRFRRHLYRLSFRNQIVVFVLMGLLVGILSLIYVLVMTRLLFS